jgi:GNAT superfamily N-acetyltransferase
VGFDWFALTTGEYEVPTEAVWALRQHDDLDSGKYPHLTEEIRERGILDPVEVSLHDDERGAVLRGGSHRANVALLLGIPTMAVNVVDMRKTARRRGTGGQRILWRGLQFGTVDQEALDEILQDVGGFVQRQLASRSEIGIHWTDDPTSAFNFALDRDPEGWAHETYGVDDEGKYTIGLVLEAQVADSDVLDPESEEGQDYAFSDAILDYGIEREVTVRGNSPVQITQATFAWVDPEGMDGEKTVSMGMRMQAASWLCPIEESQQITTPKGLDVRLEIKQRYYADSGEVGGAVYAYTGGQEIGYLPYGIGVGGGYQIGDLAVHKDFRRRGVATAMLEYVRSFGVPIGHSKQPMTPDGEGFAQSVGKVAFPWTEGPEDSDRCTETVLNQFGIFGRAPRDGLGVLDALMANGWTYRYVEHNGEPFRGTVREFYDTYKVGQFYIASRGHAMAMIDGLLVDSAGRGPDGRHIIGAFEIYRKGEKSMFARTASGPYYRLHKQSRAWLLAPTSQEFTHNLYDDIRHQVGPVQQGYSCFENPWHLWHYILTRRWDYADVAEFNGTDTGLKGVDGEPLVIPDGPPRRWFTWPEFQDWVRTQPMGRRPDYKSAWGALDDWGMPGPVMDTVLRSYDPDEANRLFGPKVAADSGASIALALAGLDIPEVARDGDCIPLSGAVLTALKAAGFTASVETLYGWVAPGVVGFAHYAVQVETPDGPQMVDASATQFEATLPPLIIAPVTDYLKLMMRTTGVAEVTVGLIKQARGGEWDMSGSEPRWVQPAEELLEDALAAWKGYPDDIRRHLMEAIRGNPLRSPSSGNEKVWRAQAEAMLDALRTKSSSSGRQLYRGGSSDGVPREGDSVQWTVRGLSSNKATAKQFAKGSYPTLFVVEPGATVFRIADFLRSDLDQLEQEYLVSGRFRVIFADISQSPWMVRVQQESSEITGSISGPGDQSDPMAEALEKILLPYGGHTLVWMGDPDAKHILDQGRYLAGGVEPGLWKGDSNNCHSNACWLSMKVGVAKIWTGYALSDDGMWRSHSWCVDSETGEVMETTVVRVGYFGAPVPVEPFFRVDNMDHDHNPYMDLSLDIPTRTWRRGNRPD